MSKKALIIFISVLVGLIVIVSVLSIYFFGEPKFSPQDDIHIFVTTIGFGDKDAQHQQLDVLSSDSIKEIFSKKYPDIYESFGKPLVLSSGFESFNGIKCEPDKYFKVSVNGVFVMDIAQEYVKSGDLITIEYANK